MKKNKETNLFVASILALFGIGFQFFLGVEQISPLIYMLLLIIVAYIMIRQVVKVMLVKEERAKWIMYSGIWIAIFLMYTKIMLIK